MKAETTKQKSTLAVN